MLPPRLEMLHGHSGEGTWGASLGWTVDNYVVQAVKTLLIAESLKPPITRVCPVCSSVMEYRIITFYFADSETAWDVPLPFCRECSSETP